MQESLRTRPFLTTSKFTQNKKIEATLTKNLSKILLNVLFKNVQTNFQNYFCGSCQFSKFNILRVKIDKMSYPILPNSKPNYLKITFQYLAN